MKLFLGLFLIVWTLIPSQQSTFPKLGSYQITAPMILLRDYNCFYNLPCAQDTVMAGNTTVDFFYVIYQNGIAWGAMSPDPLHSLYVPLGQVSSCVDPAYGTLTLEPNAWGLIQLWRQR